MPMTAPISPAHTDEVARSTAEAAAPGEKGECDAPAAPAAAAALAASVSEAPNDSEEPEGVKAPATVGEELTEQGRVSAAVLGAWLQAAGGGARVVPLMLVPMILVEALQLGSSWWLTQWANAPAERNRFYLAGYAGWALAAALLTVVRHMIVLSVGLSAGSGMHDQLLISLLRAPVAFFDVTPIGRLLARFSRDLQTVDVALPSAVQTLGSTTFAVVSALAVVCANSPMFALTLPLLGWAYVSFSSFYMASSREMKRLESSTRAPMLTHVSETLDGLDTIRAYNSQSRFGRQAELKIDRNVRAGLASAIANCWLGLRLELLGATLAAIAALLAFGRGPSLLQGAAAAATQAVESAVCAATVEGPPILGKWAMDGVCAATEATVGVEAAAAAAVAGAAAGAGARTRSVGRAALSVSLAMQVTQALNWSVRQAAELEAHLVAVERMRTYSDVPPEPGYTADDVPNLRGLHLGPVRREGRPAPASRQTSSMEPPDRSHPPARSHPTDRSSTTSLASGAPETWVASGAPPPPSPLAGWWPSRSWWAEPGLAAAEKRSGDQTSRGALVLENVGLRYRPGLPLALEGLSVRIKAGEKVGVVGRTGSGKSSLLMALTRLVAPPLRSGSIWLDGSELSSLPLLSYRSSVCVIPQEATLFEGSVRFNLDPLGRYTEGELWRVLQRVQLTHAIHTLDEHVLEEGANLSAGQRQLLCIARALLTRPAIVIMDEATSSVDSETDALIQVSATTDGH